MHNEGEEDLWEKAWRDFLGFSCSCVLECRWHNGSLVASAGGVSPAAPGRWAPAPRWSVHVQYTHPVSHSSSNYRSLDFFYSGDRRTMLLLLRRKQTGGARISLCAAGLFSEDDVLRGAATADEGMFSFRFAPVSGCFNTFDRIDRGGGSPRIRFPQYLLRILMPSHSRDVASTCPYLGMRENCELFRWFFFFTFG